MTDLFVEIFPVMPDATPALFAYDLHTVERLPSRDRDLLGGRLAGYLRRSYPGMWLWLDGMLISDGQRSAIELTITLDVLKADQPQRFAIADAITPRDQPPPPETIANYVLRTQLRDLADAMQDALDRDEMRIRNATVEREHRMQAWAVGDEPAVSISIASRLIYDQNAMSYIGPEHDMSVIEERLTGLWATDPVTGRRGEITEIVGRVADHRERLLAEAPPHIDMADLQNAMAGELVVSLRAGKTDYDYLASNLWLIVRLPHLARYDVDAKRAIKALQMAPRTRAMIVKTVSDITKEAGVLGSSYNARTHPDRFFSADFEMNLRFGEGRVRPYDAAKLIYDFTALGTHQLRPRFTDAPMRVCVVNTLSMKLADFVEAMQRALKRSFDFQIDVVRERQVRVVSRKNLESAVRVVEKEDPDMILVFFPDEVEGMDDDTDADATADYLRSLTLGRGLPTHVIRQSTLDDPDAMPGIIMGMLGKTGNVPYVLAEPLDTVDFVVGLDVVRQYRKTADETRITAIARVYASDGVFVGYRVRDVVQTQPTPPIVLIRDLFPQKFFSNRRVLIHHDGPFNEDTLAALAGWGQAIHASFIPVEILKTGAPRIYALENGITAPPWGSAFKLNDQEALLVSSVPQADISPQPLQIRVRTGTIGGKFELPPPINIDTALRSVLVWTLLAYGAEAQPKFPVTTLNAESLAYWLGRGGYFESNEGEVPFWL